MRQNHKMNSLPLVCGSLTHAEELDAAISKIEDKKYERDRETTGKHLSKRLIFLKKRVKRQLR